MTYTEPPEGDDWPTDLDRGADSDAARAVTACSMVLVASASAALAATYD